LETHANPETAACTIASFSNEQSNADYHARFNVCSLLLRHPNRMTKRRRVMNTAENTPSESSHSVATVDLKALKARQQVAWSAGDYAIVGTTLQIVGEQLCEALDVRSGQRVLDVAAGNGNASLAAARRWCRVVATDYVPALLARARERADAERLDIEFQEADAEALSFPDASFDAVVSTFGVMFAADQDRAAAEMLRVCRRGGKIGLANWTPDGFIGSLFRTIGKHVAPPAGAKSPALWGTQARLAELFDELDHLGATRLRISLSLTVALAGRVQELLRPGAQDLRCARTRGTSGTEAGPHGVGRTVQSLGGRHYGGPQRVSGNRDHAALTCVVRAPFICR
jgi:SAM-dependent methyltransferase